VVCGCELFRCKWILDADGEPRHFSAKEQHDVVMDVIEPMASNGMRTICIAYKDYLPGECCLTVTVVSTDET